MSTKQLLRISYATVLILFITLSIGLIRVWSEGTSWALGISIPDGVDLDNGLKLDWRGVSNLTAFVKLPVLHSTDGVVYAILSGMTSSGMVVQVAAGLYPGDENWLGYVLYIQDISMYPQHYTWVVNRSMPKMKPSDLISISIYSKETGEWMYNIKNLVSREFSEGLILNDGSICFKSGEQEVFALEAYTTNPQVFNNMEALVLESIYVNNIRVNGTWYVLGDWDFARNPLFVVGGGSVPSFISIVQMSNHSAVWSYNPPITVDYYPDVGPLRIAYGATLLVIATLAGILIWNKKKKEGKGVSGQPSYFLRYVTR